MKITVLQTADPIFYYPMLTETAKTVRALCARNGFSYEQYVGLKRGHMPWQASYNRIYLLKEMIDRGVEGWVLYLDADAFIHDLGFDLGAYLEERSHAAAIFAGYSTCETSYDVNSGGFAINLSHPVGKAIVIDWYRSIATVDPLTFDSAVHWEHDLGNDQHLLVGVLRHYVEELKLDSVLIFERANQSYVNNGPFVAQLLRSFFGSFAERLAAVKKRVAEVMASEPALAEHEGPGVYMPAHHPRLVTSCGRKTIAGIRSTGQSGGLMFGPYIRLGAGRHVARIIGDIRPRPGQPAKFVSDVAINRGFVVLATDDVQYDAPARGILSQFPFELDEDTDSLEVRVVVPEGVDMSIQAIQIVDGPVP